MPITASERQELDVAIEKQTAVVDDLSARTNEMRESDAKIDRTKWTELTNDYAVAEMQLARLEKKREEANTPSAGLNAKGVRKAIEASPSTRFLQAAARSGNGNNGLEAWEIDAQREIAEASGFENIRRPGDYVMPLRAYGTTQAVDLIQTDVMPNIVEKLVNYGAAKRMSQNITTAGGNPLQVPNADESTQIGSQIGEGAEAPDATDVTQDEHTLKAWTYTSKKLMVSKQSIADTSASGFDIVGYQLRQAARRLGRVLNRDFTVGDGTDKPQGFVTAAGTGVQIEASGGGGNVVYKDLVKLIGAIDPAYLEGGEADMDGSMAEGGGVIGWQFHNAFLTVLRSMLDGDNRPLWAPGLSSIANNPTQNMLLGYPYVVNQHMNSTLTGANTVVAVFGNFSYHMIRSVDSVLIRLFDDGSTADTNQVKIIGYARADSRYIGSGTTADAFQRLKAKA